MQVHIRSRSACVASLDEFVLMRCYGAVAVDDIRATQRAHEICGAAAPGGVAAIIVVDPETGMPTDDAVRKTAVDVMKKTQPNVRASVTAFRGDGFWASAMRGVLTTFDLLASSKSRQKTARTESEAVDWMLAELSDVPPTYRSVLLDALASMSATNAG